MVLPASFSNREFHIRAAPLRAAGLLSLALLLLPSLPAQNEMPPDGPAPLVAPDRNLPFKERLKQVLATKELQEVARFLNADAAHRPAILGTLLKQPEKWLGPVQWLNNSLQPMSGVAGAPQKPLPDAEQRQWQDVSTALADLENRLLSRQRVRQLGDPRYPIRAAAARDLAQAGRRSVADLTWGLASPDLEIASVCLRLLIEIRGRGFVGINFVQMPTALSVEEAVKKGLPFVGGVTVEGVIDDLPGAKAGLKGQDIIIGLGPLRIVTWSDLLRAVATLGPEYTGPLTFVRDGKTQTTSIQLGTFPDN